MRFFHRPYSLLKMVNIGLVIAILAALSGCSTTSWSWLPFVTGHEDAPARAERAEDYTYIIGPGDSLNVFVWRNPELNTGVSVRPDGKFSTSLVENLEASGKTPSELAREIETALSEYIRDPLVTVTVGGFVGEYYEQIRVVGEAQEPAALPYRKNMTLLDVMIFVGGLTEFAAGNRATLVRTGSDGQTEYRVRIEDLIKNGDISANVAMQPGDILIIPEAWF
ncbi:MAG: polysaccharide export protein [Gammaproteobacteria bacterium]|nr:polysaccharide export protein [Gammaproteobacteria bacterium]